MSIYCVVIVMLGLIWSCSCQSTWRQSCDEIASVDIASGQCGTRKFNRQGIKGRGEAYEKEFPWSCILLNKKDKKKVIANCVVVPINSRNGRESTNKILTVASKVWWLDQNPNDVIVRVGDYNITSAQNNHLDYNVQKILVHPDFKDERLVNNIAIVFTKTYVDVTRQNINTVCFPSCRNQFNFTFTNGTGTRCWVSGWNEDSPDGLFSKIMQKADLPLVGDVKCNKILKAKFDKQVPGAGLGDLFTLDKSEICAGGEAGKDSCNGGGGSPLVCQGRSKRWSLVGLVSWGLGCRDLHVPGIYTKITTFQRWIDNAE